MKSLRGQSAHLVLFPVHVGDLGVCQDEVVGDDVGLGARVSRPAVEVEQQGAAARRLEPGVVALDGDRVRLVERDPVPHAVSEGLEACLGVLGEVVAARTSLLVSEMRNTTLRRQRMDR